ncbi:hypothetical protein [Flavobacterium sp.]|jgi:hypothetical protein|uniref:hypothetical protein n=1 Tax=Flavobacterium sp. TaxID=239 RepID=UPI0037C06FA8
MKNLFTILFAFLSFSSFSQNNPLIISKVIAMPKDSLESKKLILSLNNLLTAKEKSNEENNFVWKNENVETYILLDEMKGVEKSGKNKDDFFFKPYLTNIVKLNDLEYYIQLSYIGMNENVQMLRASFELIAHKENDDFKFSSSLLRNTSSWETMKVNNCIFHYKSTINTATAKNYGKAVAAFDKKLNAKNQQTDIYLCSDLPELLKIIGTEYKLDYNSRLTSTFSSKSDNRLLIVKGDNDTKFDNFDLHDLWHERLKNVVSSKIINKPVDEGCAYLYGGSWGISWKTIFKTFKEKVANDKQKNWLENYGKFDNFGETKETHLMAEYVINALIVQKIEKEKGFAGVLEFVSCGKYNKENDNYFQSLEKLTGITKTNFNEKVWELINAEK